MYGQQMVSKDKTKEKRMYESLCEDERDRKRETKPGCAPRREEHGEPRVTKKGPVETRQ